MPELLTRAPYDNWLEAGAKDLEQRVHDRVREIVESHETPPLPDDVTQELRAAVQRAEEKFGKGESS
jgi:trimethylamine--corrinoid protein Co-methyltransferase